MASAKLGLIWHRAWNGPDEFPGCLYAEDGRNKVYFNVSPNPRRTNLNPEYAAICKGSKISTWLILKLSSFDKRPFLTLEQTLFCIS